MMVDASAIDQLTRKVPDLEALLPTSPTTLIADTSPCGPRTHLDTTCRPMLQPRLARRGTLPDDFGCCARCAGALNPKIENQDREPSRKPMDEPCAPKSRRSSMRSSSRSGC